LSWSERTDSLRIPERSEPVAEPGWVRLAGVKLLRVE
jgi:hypothetical protein